MTTIVKPTEELEAELAKLSTNIDAGSIQLSDDKNRFGWISAELARRRTTADEQPAPQPDVTWEQALTRENQRLESDNRALVNKIIMMESEQGKLVVETMIAKDEKRVLEERLTLVSKLIKSQPSE
jgi:hypothetical protein